jgi:hypothetical protein
MGLSMSTATAAKTNPSVVNKVDPGVVNKAVGFNYCNGDTMQNCIRSKGQSWCNRYCRNMGPNDYCNGDTVGNCQKYNGSWCLDNCRQRNNQFYKQGIEPFTNNCNDSNDNYSSENNNNNNFLYLLLIIICILIMYFMNNKNKFY